MPHRMSAEVAPRRELGASVVPSVLYKYRSVENWKFLEDIFSNRRLFAATFRSLNDPMEGLLYKHDKDVSLSPIALVSPVVLVIG
jgi:hypothetical protein